MMKGKTPKIQNGKANKKHNIRGLKSKVDPVQELVADCQPNLLSLVETHMQEEEEMRIPGYETIYWNDKTSNGGGIIIAVKDTVKTITMQVKEETEVQQTWILLNNQKKENKSRSDMCTTRRCDNKQKT